MVLSVDIHNMVREASVLVMRDKRSNVTEEDLLKALTDVMTNLEKPGKKRSFR